MTISTGQIDPFRAGAVIPPDAGEAFDLLSHSTLCKIGGSATGGTFSLLEPNVPPGAGAPPHIHHREDEALYVVAGRFALEIGERTLVANPGDFLFAPCGVLHAFQNIGKTPGRLISFVTPAGVEDLFCKVTQLLSGSGGGPPDYPALQSLTDEYAVEIPRLRELARHPPSGDSRAACPRQVTPKPRYVPAGAGRRFSFGDHTAICKASAADTGGAFSFFHAEAGPGNGVPPHIHQNEEVTFYILSSRFGMLLGGRTVEAVPGTCVFAPRDLVRAWWNAGSEPGRMLVMTTPGGFERFLAKSEWPGSAAAAATEEDVRERMDAALARHGIEGIASVK